MPSNRICPWLPALLGLATVDSHASAGDLTDYAGGALMLLGLLAIFISVRNMKGLQHKQPLFRRQLEPRDAKVDDKSIVRPRSDA